MMSGAEALFILEFLSGAADVAGWFRKDGGTYFPELFVTTGLLGASTF